MATCEKAGLHKVNQKKIGALPKKISGAFDTLKKIGQILQGTLLIILRVQIKWRKVSFILFLHQIKLCLSRSKYLNGHGFCLVKHCQIWNSLTLFISLLIISLDGPCGLSMTDYPETHRDRFQDSLLTYFFIFFLKDVTIKKIRKPIVTGFRILY